MAIICRDHRLLFILAPHTASSAVAFLLRERLGGEWLPKAEIRDARGRVIVRRKHSTVAELMDHDLLSPEERDGLAAFTAVRNPFDSLVSLYLKHAVKDQPLLDSPGSWVHRRKGKLAMLEYCRDHTFEEWIERLTSQPPHRPLTEHQDGVDVVLRFERLQEDLDAFLKSQGITERLIIPTRNVTHARADRHYRDFYPPRTRAQVEQAYAMPLERFDYSF